MKQQYDGFIGLVLLSIMISLGVTLIVFELTNLLISVGAFLIMTPIIFFVLGVLLT